MSEQKRGIHELYETDPIEADEMVWGRRSNPVTRRGFLTKGGLVAMSTAVGASIPFAHLMPGGLIPAALAQTDEPFTIPGKEGLIVLNDRPINAETPAHLLDDKVTPGKYLFVRNNGRPPAMTDIDAQTWRLEIGGESAGQSASFSIGQLKGLFKRYTYQLQIECGGNGRSEFVPPAAGNQWSTGAVGCPEWTGVRLKDVLEHVGINDDAVYVAYYGADMHASGDPTKGADLPWRAARQSARERVADCLGNERRGHSTHERLPVAARLRRLAGLRVRQMAEEDRDTQPGPRWPQDDGHFVSRTLQSGRTGQHGTRRTDVHHRIHACEITDYDSEIGYRAHPGYEASLTRTCVGRRQRGQQDACLNRFRGDMEKGEIVLAGQSPGMAALERRDRFS